MLSRSLIAVSLLLSLAGVLARMTLTTHADTTNAGSNGERSEDAWSPLRTEIPVPCSTKQDVAIASTCTASTLPNTGSPIGARHVTASAKKSTTKKCGSTRSKSTARVATAGGSTSAITTSMSIRSVRVMDGITQNMNKCVNSLRPSGKPGTTTEDCGGTASRSSRGNTVNSTTKRIARDGNASSPARHLSNITLAEFR